MPESCTSISKATQQYLWRSIISLTVLVCILFLYISYLYRGEIEFPSQDDNRPITGNRIMQNGCEDVCLTAECVQLANSLTENIDFTVDPCEDFYSYACGGWSKKYVAGQNHSVRKEMEILTRLNIKEVLEQIQESPEPSLGKLKTVYDTCISYSASEINAVPSILKFLDRLGFSGWPTLPDEFQFSKPTLAEALAVLISYHEFGFVSFAYTKSNDSNFRFNFIIYPTNSRFLSEESYKRYEPEVFKVLNYLGVTDDLAAKMWNDFKNIDSQFFQSKEEFHATDYRDPDKDLSPIDCSTEDNENMVFICDIMNHMVDYNNIGNVYPKDFAFTKQLDFLQALKPFLSNFSDSSLASYLALRVFIDHLGDLNHFFRQMTSNPKSVFYEKSNARLSKQLAHMREFQCIEWLSQKLTYSLSQAYVFKIIKAEIIDEINEIVKTVIKEIASFIEQQKWMSEGARQTLSKNVNDLRNNFMNTTSDVINQKLNFILNKFHPVNDSFFMNVMENQKQRVITFLEHFEEFKDSNFPSEPFATNAGQMDDYFDLDFGILLPPVYQFGLPRYFNLISLGEIVGHELGHGIIPYFYSEDEELDNQTRDHFLTLQKCLEDQYFNFDLQQINKKVRGNVTFHENFSDFIGFQVAEKLASKIVSDGTEKGLLLPGLSLSLKQLFYIIPVQFYCEIHTKQREEEYYHSNAHAPAFARVNGKVQNSKMFSQVFNCSQGSVMNPINKCIF